MSVAITTSYEPLLLRHPANPILTRKDWPYSINSVFNAGATLLQTARLFCFAASKIDGGCLIFALPARGMASTAGKLTTSRR